MGKRYLKHSHLPTEDFANTRPICRLFFYFSLAFLWVMVFPYLVWAIQVQAVVDRTSVTLGESIELLVTIEGADGNVDVSVINDFKVISRGSSSSFEFINGSSSRKMIYNYALLPLKEGPCTIPALPVNVRGKTQYTEPIVIHVNEKNTADQSSRDLFLKVDVSNKQPFVGEQISCTFTLFNAVQVTEAQFIKPDFDGFSAKEVENQNTRRTVINGREYIQRELTYILIPQKPGKLIIKPAEIQCNVVKQTQHRGMRSPFDDFFGRTQVEPRYLQSDPLTLTVKALPQMTQSGTFSGLVGQFQLDAKIEKNVLTVGDSVTLTLTLSGNGNILDASKVHMKIPATFKHYDDTPQEEIKLTPHGYVGKKIFRTALVPVEAGNFSLPEVKLVYFNVKNERYEILSTAPIALTVNPSNTPNSQIVTTDPISSGKPKSQVKFTGRDILSIKEDLDALKSHSAFSLTDFLIWLMIPVAGFLGVKLTTGYLLKENSRQKQMARQTRRTLKAAAKTNPEEKEFLSLLYKALVTAVRTRSGTQGESLTWNEAKMLLRQNGCNEEIGQEVALLLEEIESANYSGAKVNIEERRKLFAKTQSITGRLLK